MKFVKIILYVFFMIIFTLSSLMVCNNKTELTIENLFSSQKWVEDLTMENNNMSFSDCISQLSNIELFQIKNTD